MNAVRCFYSGAWLLWRSSTLSEGVSWRKTAFHGSTGCRSFVTRSLSDCQEKLGRAVLKLRLFFLRGGGRSSGLCLSCVFGSLHSLSAGFPSSWFGFRCGVVSRTPRSSRHLRADRNLRLKLVKMIVTFFYFYFQGFGVSRFCGVLLDIDVQYQKTTITHITEGVLCC